MLRCNIPNLMGLARVGLNPIIGTIKRKPTAIHPVEVGK